jgi:hypothetical protein
LARCLGLALSNIFVSWATFNGPSLGLPLWCLIGSLLVLNADMLFPCLAPYLGNDPS